MKFTINTVLYLLCASVVTVNVSFATDLVKEYSKTDEQKENDLYLEAFVNKCADAVQGIWKGMHSKKTTLDQDIIEAEKYVDKYTWTSHQTGRIKNDFVKALYDKMKTYKHMSLKSQKLLGLDEIIKEGSVSSFKRRNTENLENVKYARLLCKIATKIFTWYMHSGTSLKAITTVEEEIAKKKLENTPVNIPELDTKATVIDVKEEEKVDTISTSEIKEDTPVENVNLIIEQPVTTNEATVPEIITEHEPITIENDLKSIDEAIAIQDQPLTLELKVDDVMSKGNETVAQTPNYKKSEYKDGKRVIHADEIGTNSDWGTGDDRFTYYGDGVLSDKALESGARYHAYGTPGYNHRIKTRQDGNMFMSFKTDKRIKEQINSDKEEIARRQRENVERKIQQNEIQRRNGWY